MTETFRGSAAWEMLSRTLVPATLIAATGACTTACIRNAQDDQRFLERGVSERVELPGHELLERASEHAVVARYIGPRSDVAAQVKMEGATFGPLWFTPPPSDPLVYITGARYTEPGGQRCFVTIGRYKNADDIPAHLELSTDHENALHNGEQELMEITTACEGSG
jgi:hypothetical protein